MYSNYCYSAFTRSVSAEDESLRRMMGEGDIRKRKVAVCVPVHTSFVLLYKLSYCRVYRQGAVPHDLGSPTDSPWRRLNAYNFQDVCNWKDLGPKLILQVGTMSAVIFVGEVFTINAVWGRCIEMCTT